MFTALLFVVATPFEDATGLALKEDFAIANVASGSAADDAGLAPSDQLVHVNGKAVAGMKVAELSEFVQKRGGTTHRLVVKRDGKSKLVTLRLDKPV